MNQHRVTRCILQDHLNLGDLIERIDAIPRLVSHDRDSKVHNAVRLDKLSAFLSVSLFDKGAMSRELSRPWRRSDEGYIHDSLQLQRLQMVQIARLRKAAPVDACSDGSKVDDLACVRSWRTSWLEG